MSNEYILTPNGDLYHWGIKGMKWGVRRYQNKDGSLTAAGRKRYADEEEALAEREKNISAREQAKAHRDRIAAKTAELDAREAALKKKSGDSDYADGEKKPSAKDMTDEELNYAIARARMEDTYNNLRPNKTESESTTKEKKDPADMTDEELTKAINRARLEDTYRQLRPEEVSAGKQFMQKFAKDAVIPAVTSASKTFIQDALTKASKDLLKDNTPADPNSYEALKKTYDTLKLKVDIDKLKNPDKYMSAEDRKKTYELKRQKKKDAEADASDAKKAKDKADKAAGEKRRRQQELRDAMMRSDNRKEQEAAFERYINNLSDDFDFTPNIRRGRQAVDDFDWDVDWDDD